MCGVAIAEALACPVTGSIGAVILCSTNTSYTWKQFSQTFILDLSYVYVCVPVRVCYLDVGDGGGLMRCWIPRSWKYSGCELPDLGAGTRTAGFLQERQALSVADPSASCTQLFSLYIVHLVCCLLACPFYVRQYMI